MEEILYSWQMEGLSLSNPIIYSVSLLLYSFQLVQHCFPSTVSWNIICIWEATRRNSKQHTEPKQIPMLSHDHSFFVWVNVWWICLDYDELLLNLDSWKHIMNHTHHHSMRQFPSKLFRQETPNSVGGRKSMLSISLNTSNSMCRTSYQNLRPGHQRWFHKSVKEWPSTSRILQDLHTRTSYKHPRRTCIQAWLMHSIFKILMQGPLKEVLNRISTGSSQILDKIMQGPLRWFQHDLHKIFSYL